MFTVLLVDDHSSFRAAAREILELGAFRVIAEACDARGARIHAASHQPDVVLLDIGLPDADGWSVADWLQSNVPDARVVMVSSRPIEEIRTRLADAPVVGFISKNALTATSLLEALSA